MKRIAKWLVCHSCQFSSTQVRFHSFLTQADQNLLKFESFFTTNSNSLAATFKLPEYRSVGQVQYLRSNLKEDWRIQDSNACFREILKQGVMGNIEEMEILCNQMPPFTEEALTQLMQSFRKNHRSEEGFWSLQFLNQGMLPKTIVNNSQVDEYLDTLNDYLKYLGQRHQLSKALSLFDQISCPNTQTFEIMISTLCRKGFLVECLEVLDKMLDLECIPPGLLFYNKVIPFLCQSGNVSKAFVLFTMIKSFGFSPDYFIYEALIKSFAWHTCRTVRLVDEMIQCGFTPKADLYASIVREFTRAMRFEEAAKFLENRSLSAPDLHNAILYHGIFFCKFDKATNYFERMVEKNVANMESWSILIKGFRQQGEDLKAIEILKRAISSLGCTICTCQNAAYDLLIQKISDPTIKLDELIRLYSLVYQFGIPCSPSVYNNMLLSLYQMGRTKAVILMFSRMLIMGCGLNSAAYSVLIHSMCTENKTTDCASLFDLMVSDGLVPNSETLGRLLHYMACYSQLPIVMPALHKIASEDRVLSLAIYYMLTGGLWKDALRMLCQRLHGWCVSFVGWSP